PGTDLAALPRLARDRLPLPRVDRPGVDQPVAAVRDLQPAAGEESPNGPGGGERLREAHLPPDVGGGHGHDLPDLDAGRDRREEGVDAVEGLLVHWPYRDDSSG